MASSLRKGHCYSRVKRAYTRKSKFKKKGFIKAVPASRIVKYDMGELTKRDFTYRIDLVVKNPVQIRQNALESCRLIINRHLTKDIGLDNYYFKLRVYPHHVLRENRMLTGAGADRMQTGMQQAFGTPVSIAAQLKKNQAIFSVKTNKEHVLKAKAALKRATPRMPGNFNIVITPLNE